MTSTRDLVAPTLAIDLGTVQVDELRAGDHIRREGYTWRVDRHPTPSIWGTIGHATHCPACRCTRGMPPATDCDRSEPVPHLDLWLTAITPQTKGASIALPAGARVTLIARGTPEHHAIPASSPDWRSE